MIEDLIFIYILKLANNRYYTGITSNLQRRITEHREGKSISTRKHLPVDLIYVTAVIGRKEARKVEKKIKARGAGRYLTDKQYKENLPYNNILNKEGLITDWQQLKDELKKQL